MFEAPHFPFLFYYVFLWLNTALVLLMLMIELSNQFREKKMCYGLNDHPSTLFCRLELWISWRSCAVSPWLWSCCRYHCSYVLWLCPGHRQRWNPDALTPCLFHSLPESGCPLMPSVNKAQMRRLHLLQNPWSSHGRSFWVIIIFVLCLLQAVQNCFYNVLGDIFCMSKAVRHACINAYRSS